MTLLGKAITIPQNAPQYEFSFQLYLPYLSSAFPVENYRLPEILSIFDL